jgi:hypothetical protein
MARTFIFEVVGRTLVAVQNELPIDDGEWLQFVDVVAHGDYHGIIVWAPKTGPSAGQRTSGRKAVESRGKYTPLAIMTNSPIARAVVSVFTVFMGDQIRAFAPTDFEGAFRGPNRTWLRAHVVSSFEA